MNTNNEENVKPTTANPAEPKPTHGAGVKFSLHTLDGYKPNEAVEMFVEPESPPSNIQAGACVPLAPNNNATEVLYWVNKLAISDIDWLIIDLERILRRKPKNKQDAVAMQTACQVIINELTTLRNRFCSTNLCVGEIVRDMISAELKRNAKLRGVTIEVKTNK